jgi:hypothetical protein
MNEHVRAIHETVIGTGRLPDECWALFTMPAPGGLALTTPDPMPSNGSEWTRLLVAVLLRSEHAEWRREMLAWLDERKLGIARIDDAPVEGSVGFLNILRDRAPRIGREQHRHRRSQ